MHATKLAAVTALVLHACMLAEAPALAGTFDIKGADVEKGETEVAVPAAVQSGFPENAELVRQSWEFDVSYGFTDRFKLGAKINLDQPLPEEPEDGAEKPRRKRLRPSTVGLEGQYVLLKPEKGMPALSWFTGVDASVHRDETNTLTFGPLIGFGDDKLSLTLNPLLARTFGRNSDPGLAFAYAWQVKREMVENVALALEGFGTIPDIGDAPGIEFQEHRIGPVLLLDGELFGMGKTASKPMKLGGHESEGEKVRGPKGELQIGVLFGLTDATPDLTGKFKFAITW